LFEFILFVAAIALIVGFGGVGLSAGGGGYTPRDGPPKVPPVGGSAVGRRK